MGYTNLNTQEKIRRSKRYVEPLIIDIRTDYFTACPNPIEFDIKVISGKIKEHYYQWEIISGAPGKFVPSSRVLNSIFDPIGNKEKRIARLTIDKGTSYEQIFLLNLFDIATSFNETVVGRESSVFPFYNEIEKACTTIDMNFSTADIPLLNTKESILSFSNYGNIIYINNDIYKVEIFDYPSMTLSKTFYYPSTEILTIDLTKRYLAKTWYRSSLHIPDTYAWTFINIINITNGNLSALIIEDYPELIHYDSSGLKYTLISSGYRVINNIEVPEIVLNYNGSKIRAIGLKWDIKNSDNSNNTEIVINNPINTKSAANNSPKLQSSSSGSGIHKLLNFKTGTVG